MKKILQFSNILALMLTIGVNYLSNTGIFNGNTMASVSGSYQNLFTPAGYAFSIWGLIYISLTAFIIHQSKGLFSSADTPPVVKRIGWAFVFSCAMNCLWVVAWLYDYTGFSVVIMILLLASLLFIVKVTRMELDVIPLKTIALEWWPFSIYLGWICVALIANVSAFLTKIGWDAAWGSQTTWTLIMMGVAVAIYLLLIWKRNMREAAGAGIWALIAVGVANHHQNKAVFITAIIAASVIFIAAGTHGYLNKGRHYEGERS